MRDRSPRERRRVGDALRFRTPYARALGALFVAFAAACTAEAEPQAPPLPPGTTIVRVAGAEPRARLRLQPKAGQKESATFVLSVNTAAEVDGKALPAAKPPATRIEGELRVDEVLANGDARTTFRFGGAEPIGETGIQPELLSALKAKLTDLKGLSVKSLTNPRGIVQEAKIEFPAAADGELRQLADGMRDSIARMSIPFPEEEVGVGAQWENSLSYSFNGLAAKAVARYELLERQENRIRLKIAVTLSSPRQDVKLPGGPDASATVESLTGGGTGETSMDLTHMLALASKMDVSMQLRMSGREKTAAKRQTMNMKMEMGMTLESK